MRAPSRDREKGIMWKTIAYSVLFHGLMAASLFAVVYGADSVVRFGIVGHKGANVYYDAYHGARHLWNRDNQRYYVAYHTVSGYNRFYKMLQENGYDVHVETYKPFNRRILNRYQVFFVGEETYHARFMSEEEQKDLIAWVKDGGGLFAIAEHTNAHYMAEVMNLLFKDLPIRVREDSICDLEQPGPVSPDWVDLPIAKDHPVTKGVKEYRFFNGSSLDTPHGVLLSSDTSWSDKSNPEDRPIQNGNKERDPDEIAGPLAGVAAFGYGKGRVVVIADHNALSNPTLYWGDHHRFAMNTMDWLAGRRLNLDGLFIPAGLLALLGIYFTRRRWRPILHASRYTLLAAGIAACAAVAVFYLARPSYVDIFVHVGNNSDMKYMTKKKGGFFTLYGQWTKEPNLRPWASRSLTSGYDALFLSAPRRAYSDPQMSIIDGYLHRGRTVVYLATIDSLESEAGDQLMNKFGFKADINRDLKMNGKKPLNVWGPRKWTDSIFRFYVHPDTPGVTVKGLDPVVYLTRGGYHISERQEHSGKHLFEVLSEKRVGRGKFMMVAPIEIWNDRGLNNLYTDSDVVQQQMSEFAIRLASNL